MSIKDDVIAQDASISCISVGQTVICDAIDGLRDEVSAIDERVRKLECQLQAEHDRHLSAKSDRDQWRAKFEAAKDKIASLAAEATEARQVAAEIGKLNKAIRGLERANEEWREWSIAELSADSMISSEELREAMAEELAELRHGFDQANKASTLAMGEISIAPTQGALSDAIATTSYWRNRAQTAEAEAAAAESRLVSIIREADGGDPVGRYGEPYKPSKQNPRLTAFLDAGGYRQGGEPGNSENPISNPGFPLGEYDPDHWS